MTLHLSICRRLWKHLLPTAVLDFILSLT